MAITPASAGASRSWRGLSDVLRITFKVHGWPSGSPGSCPALSGFQEYQTPPFSQCRRRHPTSSCPCFSLILGAPRHPPFVTVTLHPLPLLSQDILFVFEWGPLSQGLRPAPPHGDLTLLAETSSYLHRPSSLIFVQMKIQPVINGMFPRNLISSHYRKHCCFALGLESPQWSPSWLHYMSLSLLTQELWLLILFRSCWDVEETILVLF